MKLIYLASPYSYSTRFPFLGSIIRYWRYTTITRLAACLTEEYRYAFILPITQSHQLAKYMKNKGTGFKDWSDIDYRFIESVDEVWVVKMKGWDTSIGVQAEIKYALKLNKPVRYVDEKGSLITSYAINCDYDVTKPTLYTRQATSISSKKSTAYTRTKRKSRTT